MSRRANEEAVGGDEVTLAEGVLPVPRVESPARASSVAVHRRSHTAQHNVHGRRTAPVSSCSSHQAVATAALEGYMSEWTSSHGTNTAIGGAGSAI